MIFIICYQKCVLSNISSFVIMTCVTGLGWCLLHFSAIKSFSFFLLSILCTLEESQAVQPAFEGWELCSASLRADYFFLYCLEFFYPKDLSVLSYLFNYSIIIYIIVGSWIFLLYFEIRPDTNVSN